MKQPILTERPPIVFPKTNKVEKSPGEKQDELDKMKEEFLARGGSVQKIDPGVSGRDVIKGDPLSYNPYPIREDR